MRLSSIFLVASLTHFLPRAISIRFGALEEATNSPWHALIFLEHIFTKELIPSCGGSLISKLHVLTAGHCVDPQYKSYFVYVGVTQTTPSKGTPRHPVKRTDVHPDYRFGVTGCDVALLTLVKPLVQSDKVRVIGWNQQPSIPAMNQRMDVVGNGAFDNTNGTTPVRYRAGAKVEQCGPEEAPEQAICVRFDRMARTCSGDSGSGWVLDNMLLVGVHSSGTWLCENTNAVGSVTRLSFVRDWVKNAMAKVQ